MDKDNEFKLEEVIDQEGLADTLRAIFDICHGKAEHLRSNWQDNNMAKEWEHDAKLIDTVIAKLRCN